MVLYARSHFVKRKRKNLLIILLDENECYKETGLCRGGRCENNVGSFKCVCPAGTKATSNGHKCGGKFKFVIKTVKYFS